MARRPLHRREAETQVAEEASWVCTSCGGWLSDETSDRYCPTCKSYWDDVANGLFDDPLPRDFDDGDYD